MIKEQKHYTLKTMASTFESSKKDVIEYCQRHELNFQRGNVVKYVSRAGKKAPETPDQTFREKELEDLYKALDYLQREIEFVKFLQIQEQGDSLL